MDKTGRKIIITIDIDRFKGTYPTDKELEYIFNTITYTLNFIKSSNTITPREDWDIEINI